METSGQGAGLGLEGQREGGRWAQGAPRRRGGGTVHPTDRTTVAGATVSVGGRVRGVRPQEDILRQWMDRPLTPHIWKAQLCPEGLRDSSPAGEATAAAGPALYADLGGHVHVRVPSTQLPGKHVLPRPHIPVPGTQAGNPGSGGPASREHSPPAQHRVCD